MLYINVKVFFYSPLTISIKLGRFNKTEELIIENVQRVLYFSIYYVLLELNKKGVIPVLQLDSELNDFSKIICLMK